MPVFKSMNDIKPIKIKVSQKIKGKILVVDKVQLPKDLKDYFTVHFKKVIEQAQVPIRTEINKDKIYFPNRRLETTYLNAVRELRIHALESIYKFFTKPQLKQGLLQINHSNWIGPSIHEIQRALLNLAFNHKNKFMQGIVDEKVESVEVITRVASADLQLVSSEGEVEPEPKEAEPNDDLDL